jgi:hypothetical protein
MSQTERLSTPLRNRHAEGALTTSVKGRRGVPEKVLLADLLRVANQLRQRTLAGELYDQLGRFSSQTFARRFGSWTAALLLVGLEPAHWRDVPVETILHDMRRVARQTQSARLRQQDYRQNGKYSFKIIYHFFDCWQNALEAAGLAPVFYRALSQNELFDNLVEIHQKLGRWPTREEIKPPLSRFGFKAYKRRFGSIHKTLTAMETTTGQDISYRRKPRRTPEAINWRLRFRALERNGFRCCHCGKSPATDRQITLHVRHGKPWQQGGETILENLRVLCQLCISRSSKRSVVGNRRISKR